MTALPNTNELWWEICGELCDVAEWFAGGGLTPEDFQRCVVTFEAKKMERYGFELRGEVADSGNVRFSLRQVESGELWSTVEVNPDSGELVVR